VLSERTAGNVDAAGAFSKTKIVKFSGEEIMLVEFQVGVFNLYVSAGDIGGGVWLIIEVNKQIATMSGREFGNIGEGFEGDVWACTNT
ncbi:hypothetical protein NL362_27880, partial [Klebsiella pneumoniae]|nr:hypothetical protein [Klebsiella pneumoniae]